MHAPRSYQEIFGGRRKDRPLAGVFFDMTPASIDQFARLRPQLVAFALRRGISREQAEDAVQETLLAALEGFDRYAGTASVSTWMFGILKHKLVDGFRRARREEPLDHPDRDGLAYAGPGPEEASEGRRTLSAVDRGLAKLPRKAAQVFVLREVLGMNVPEVCAALSITPASCWVLLHRARARLRACPEIGSLAAGAA